MKEAVEVDAPRVREAGRQLTCQVERRRQAIVDSANIMLTYLKKEANSLRFQASSG